ncbi:hypothetical protein [Leucobacter sp. VD1]|uniref:hypothetical protein n=1 Tax=Leucobacter sp. VD1 TaxID=3080381 RepID=UPI003017AE69
MLTESDLAAYVQRVRYQWIDVDKVFGAQCWDQWSHYASAFLGVPSWPTYTNAGGTHPHAGYACNVHHNAARSGLAQWFEILPATASPRPGDVAFWEFGSTWYPLSHVATVLDITHGGRTLRCLTQNPGAVQVSDLITSGIIGYLRPRTLIRGGIVTSRTPSLHASQKVAALARTRRRKDDPMHYIVLTEGARQDGSAAYAIYRPGVKGSWEEFDTNSVRGMAANALASQFGQPMEVTLDRWLQLQKKYA